MKGVAVEQAITILRPIKEVYAFFRDFENLPRFLRHFESVRRLEGNRSHCVAKSPLETAV